jgi:hypothetical protein
LCRLPVATPPPLHCSTSCCLLIVDSICCRQWYCHCHRGRCVGSSSAATAAEDDHVKVDNGVESLLSSAPPSPPRQKIRGQKHVAEALDCLNRCDGGWRRRWLAVAAGGAAMASSAGGDKKGGQHWPETHLLDPLVQPLLLP